MKSRNHQMAGEAGLKDCLGGFSITNLSDQDHIGILSH